MSPQANERTLLLVDDEENILSSLTRLLRRDGYQILKANSGEKGLEILKTNKVGVVMSDQRMPIMAGTEFLCKVKELYPETVRIVLSGYTELQTITDAINQGAIYKFLTKPWDDDLLRQNLEEAFEYYELKSNNILLNKQLEETNIELENINSSLEYKVELKTREIVANMRALQASQDTLENMPVAVVSITDDGIITLANRMALSLLATDQKVVGMIANSVLPEAIHYLYTKTNSNLEIKCDVQLASGLVVDVYCKRIDGSSKEQGNIILVLSPKSGVD